MSATYKISLPITGPPQAQTTGAAHKSHSGSKNIGKQLDSLIREQEIISVQLDSLKLHAERIRKAQRRGDLINGGIIVLFIFLVIKLFLSRKKKSAKKHTV